MGLLRYWYWVFGALAIAAAVRAGSLRADGGGDLVWFVAGAVLLAIFSLGRSADRKRHGAERS